MAFEDRTSPNTATSPNGDLSSQNTVSPNSPESSRTSSYTCRTIPAVEDTYYQRHQQESAFFRITAFALTNQQQLTLTSPRSPTDDSLKSYTHSESSRSSPQPDLVVDDEENDVPRIQTLKYSIRNILQPDFGKNAVQRTRRVTPPPKITFKPYEESPSSTLGHLCQAVSQIGHQQQRKQDDPCRLIVDEARSTESPADDSVLLNPDTLKTEDGAAEGVPKLWPAWVYCTRYSDRPSSGPRSKRAKKLPSATKSTDDKRPRTAFSGAQLARLKHEFAENRYLTERRRQQLSGELGLNEAQIKIWFQNKRAKIKKASGQKNPLALQLMAQGLYNHSTVTDEEGDMPMPGPAGISQNGQ